MTINWESRSDDADETCTLTAADKADGSAKRNEVVGLFLTTQFVDGQFGTSQLHILKVEPENGAEYNLGVWGFAHLNRKLETVPFGTMVRLTFEGEKDVGKGNPMKLGRVDVPKGTPLRPRPATGTSPATQQPF